MSEEEQRAVVPQAERAEEAPVLAGEDTAEHPGLEKVAPSTVSADHLRSVVAKVKAVAELDDYLGLRLMEGR